MSATVGWLEKLKKLLVKGDKDVVSRVEVNYDVGFGNSLFIRGEGAGLSWEKGIPMTNIAADIWMWETACPFDACVFKVLINDEEYEGGEDHLLPMGEVISIRPGF